MTAGMRVGIAVVAVGGNALTRPTQLGRAEEIAANAAEMAGALADLVRAGRQVAVVHGNGPQVGNLALQQDALAPTVPAQPLHQLSAMTQGQLGGVLARAIDAECGAGVAVSLITHVTVDPTDAAFAHPTKPIGPFLGGQEAEELARDRGWQVVEDAGRGWRRVVPSPRPIGIVELAAVRTLLAAGTVVLAAGGGGIAVSAGPDGRLTALDAVIDKDLAAAALATAVGAGELYLLTGVDCVLLDHGTARERPVHRLDPGEAERHLAAGQFPPGSMGPKITAALTFLRHGGHRAIITSAALLRAAADGTPDVGTCIERSPVPVAHLS
ncbi:MAG TPA: carbamate kinase [Blastococcus sp.]|nr:carbamate kinase [Blastococcus sp.]